MKRTRSITLAILTTLAAAAGCAGASHDAPAPDRPIASISRVEIADETARVLTNRHPFIANTEERADGSLRVDFRDGAEPLVVRIAGHTLEVATDHGDLLLTYATDSRGDDGNAGEVPRETFRVLGTTFDVRGSERLGDLAREVRSVVLGSGNDVTQNPLYAVIAFGEFARQAREQQSTALRADSGSSVRPRVICAGVCVALIAIGVVAIVSWGASWEAGDRQEAIDACTQASTGDGPIADEIFAKNDRIKLVGAQIDDRLFAPLGAGNAPSGVWSCLGIPAGAGSFTPVLQLDANVRPGKSERVDHDGASLHGRVFKDRSVTMYIPYRSGGFFGWFATTNAGVPGSPTATGAGGHPCPQRVAVEVAPACMPTLTPAQSATMNDPTAPQPYKDGVATTVCGPLALTCQTIPELDQPLQSNRDGLAPGAL